MNKLFRYLGVAIICISASGCAALNTAKYLGNRVTCTVSGDKAYVTSLWGVFGISSEVVEEDADVICGAPVQFNQLNEVK